MNNMFCNCENLEDINLLSFETKQVTNMSRMFYGCKKLEYLDLSPFAITDVSNIDEMFYNCKNTLNINNSFYGYDKLSAKIKDIPSSNIKNTIRIKEYIIVFLGGIKKER